MLSIRKAKYSDVEPIRNVMELSQNSLEDKSWYYIDGTTVEWLYRHIEDEGFALVVEDEESNIVGFLVVRYPENSDDNLGCYLGNKAEDMCTVVHMETVAVLPEYRGNGLQRKLVERAESMLRSNIKYMMCTVHQENNPSLYSFLKCGYKIEINLFAKYGRLPRYVLLKERQV